MRNKARDRSGFSLVEVTLALGVAAVCLVTIFALLPVGLQTNQNATEQVASADIMGSVIADLRATPVTIPRGNATVSSLFAISIPANPVTAATTSTLYFDTAGTVSVSPNANSRFRLTITFQPNVGSRSATLVDLKMTWPAAASLTNAAGTNEMFAGLNRN
jgi:uncharacterized protein (TIGR02598 family)